MMESCLYRVFLAMRRICSAIRIYSSCTHGEARLLDGWDNLAYSYDTFWKTYGVPYRIIW